MKPWTMWAVVHYRKRGPGHVDGPYFSRADADDVRRKQLDMSDEDNREAWAAGWRIRVTPMSRLVTTREFQRLLEERDAA